MTRLAALLVLVASSCIASACTTYVVGDSTAAQVQTITGDGNGIDGCGIMSVGLPGCPTPPRVIPDHNATTIVFLSWWDAVAGATNYGDLDTNGPAIYVELPPSLGAITFPTAAQAAAFNAAAASSLGCDLAPWQIRDAGPYMDPDGIHYTPTGAALVAARLENLDGPYC